VTDRAKGLTLGVIASLSWGTVFVAARYLTGMRGADPYLVSAGRFALASLALVAYLLLRRQGRALVAAMEDWPRFLALGLLGVVGLGVCVFTSTQYTYSVNGVLLMNSNGIFIAVLAFLVGERVPAGRYLGLAIGLAGCFLVVAGFDGPQLGGRNDLLGGLLALGGALSWALYTLLGKAPSRKWGGLVATTCAMCFGSVAMCGIAMARGVEPVLPDWEFWTVLYLAVIPTALGFVCWYAALEHVTANLIGPLQYLASVCGVVLGWAMLREPLRLSFVLGAALVFGGVWLATRRTWEPPDG
jgi:drug/metabolite transporter (DMT)-like permease